ncbi:sodium/proline symporter PutP [Agathobaculum sp.]|uniref:sodium/proline symporter PutP n=1 Tax=Agathobaculum sp. TaxID=2048138 RepID=UPI002A7EF772|nr:sodium/proline symporter PutP [Agathobaculum sp.]MDY3618608.1 sodium/proline symporter PutP [Agathobaculum sp.]
MYVSDNIVIIVAFIVYLAFMICIGMFFYGKNRTTTEYFLGGRKLGSWVTSMSAQASDMSGWLLMGLPGAAYLSGISAGWIAIGLAIGTYLNWLFVAKPLRQYTKIAGDAITLPQFFKNRYQDKSGMISVIAAVFILVFFLFYTASGFVSCAKLFSSVFGLPYLVSLAVGAVVVISYTFAGGFFAVCWTDFFQGLLMFFCVIAVPVLTIQSLGGVTPFFSSVEAFNPNFLNMFVDGATGVPYTALGIISLVAWGLGYFGQPHILVRFMGIEKPAAIKKSRRIATVWVLISLTAAVLIGVAGRMFLGDALVNGGAQETIYITLVGRLFPIFIGGIFLSAILAAIMSTADSQLLVTASAITEDFYHNKIRPNASARELMWVSRICVIAVALIAAFIATDQNSTVLGLVEYAWAGFGSAFGPLVLCSLFWKRTNKYGALAGIVVGGVVDLVWAQLSGGIFDLYEIVPGFVCGLIAIIVVSLLTPKPSAEITEQFETYRACED